MTTVTLTPSTLQGWRVIQRRPDGSVYLRLPLDLQRPIDGGCQCKAWCPARWGST